MGWDLIGKSKTITYLKENSCDLRLGKHFLDMIPKALPIKEKNDSLDFSDKKE